MYCINSGSRSIVAKDRILLTNENNNKQISSVGHGWDVNIMKLPHTSPPPKYPLQSLTFACFLNCKYNEDAKDDIDTIKFFKTEPPSDGYRKLMDKLNYTIK